MIKVGNSCQQALAQYSGDILGLRELVIDFWCYRQCHVISVLTKNFVYQKSTKKSIAT